MEAVEEVPRHLWKYLVISPVFTVPKKMSDDRRGVINLKWVNAHVKYMKYKATTMRDVKRTITKDCYMTTIDLKDAFWNVAVHPDDRRFLAFRWRGKVYQYKCLPFGLTSSPRTLHKVLRPLIASLQLQGLKVQCYVDDLIIYGASAEQCHKATVHVRKVLEKHGFVLNLNKCQLTPSRYRKYLGCNIDSVKMELSIPHNKIKYLIEDLRRVIKKPMTTGRKISSVLGKLNAMSDALLYTRVHTSGLHHLRLKAIRRGWDTPTPVTKEARDNATWWRQNLHSMNGKALIQQPSQKVIDTDASNEGWGAFLHKHNMPANGKWNSKMKVQHINCKEITAVKHGLLCFHEHIKGQTVTIRVDSIVTYFYLARMGGKIPALSRLVDEIFEIARSIGTNIRPIFIPTTENVLADYLSRNHHAKENRFLEDYMLNPRAFRVLEAKWGPHLIDLFARKHNTQLPTFGAWKPEPGAFWVDSMRQVWKPMNGYANPPFSLIMRIIHKVQTEGSTITLVAPLWPAQPWFPSLINLIVDFPILLPQVPDLFLRPPHLRGTPRQPKWPVLGWRISGDSLKKAAFLQTLSQTSSQPGHILRTLAMPHVGNDGRTTKQRLGILSSILKTIRWSNSSHNSSTKEPTRTR